MLRRVLITGGTGSLGRALVARLIGQATVERVVIYSRDEVKQAEMADSYGGDHPKLRFFLGDVREKARLVQAMYGCDTVVAAAALKRVDKVAYNPGEVLRTNIDGVRHTCEAAVEVGAAATLFVSSDKAPASTTVYGASKAAGEAITVNANVYGHPRGSRFACVRYGNVLGSRGSVIHVWRQAIAEGRPLPLTHPQMTRFWLTVDDAVDVVLKACRLMQGGEVFVPILPAMRMVDLAAAVAPAGYQMVVTGPRPGGEKLHEILLTEEEAARTLALPDEALLLVQPSVRPWSDEGYLGEPIRPDVVYRSDAWPWWLTVEEMRAFVGSIG